jgi:NAD(P)H dehydrogenase (quinone)
MNVLLLDGHPDAGRLTTYLLDIYEAALPAAVDVTRIAVRDLAFDSVLRRGYAERIEWEPGLRAAAEAIDACDHLVVAFPMWWGSEPAELKGFLDRLFLPGFTFAYHEDDPWWDKLMAGRSADCIATMDTPPFILRLVHGNALIKRWKGQVLGFCGFAPVRTLALGPADAKQLPKRLPKWEKRIAKLAGSIRAKKPETKEARLTDFLNRPINS